MIHDFHVHLYYDPSQVDEAKTLAAEMASRFDLPVGHFHLRPVGPPPRGGASN